MTRRKKTAPRKTSRSRTRKAEAGRWRRFIRAFVASSVTAFGIASCAFNPQLRESVSLDPWLAQLGLPGQQAQAPLAQANGPLVQTRFAGCPQFLPARNAPSVPAAASLRELCFSSFAILHSGQTKTPVFVVQRLNRQMLARAPQIERADRFYAEARLPKAERAELSDYLRSGYSRGHMAPAGDMHTAEAMAQSFSLANMVPQDQIHNGGAWSRIEQDTRKYISRAAGDVFVFTGPVYAGSPRTIGEGRVAVPSHLFKLVYDSTTGRSWVHWQANDPQTQAGKPIDYAEFVRRTGMRLLP
ncbi:DNA/RNA non-specific endonuclease [Verticiella sediminum]|uniref:DNA/RNA non-specific endonuclease n=1 Tax=Verticiella sediminum TaxID=1247510 RepID=A0A556A7M9_9BURK|nr:DNA/RNA non-specific endonuclease [Verticiella sediminum]TSH88904.1 DNA/RNA non-specific endonuclease [Verticiella sediminum]